ncbi:MAG: sigma-70 family RNA polymerase sigma factor [Oscillospiraceae bacterium]
MYGETTDTNAFVHCGDERFTMDAVFLKYGQTVFRAAYAFVKNTHDAEDITQEVFISLMRTMPLFESGEHCKAWLLHAAANRCKSFFKSAWQRKTTGIEENFPDESFTQSEGAVANAVSALPLKYREVIYLYYIEGYKAKELALLLHMPQNTVLSRLSRGRGLLKDALKGDFDIE